jgi:tetratricopeptide (TPR) repeat protein
VELEASNAEARVLLGQTYRADGDYGRADLLFQRASAYASVRENALIARADVAVDQEDFGGAIPHLSNAVVGNPARADLRRSIDVLEDLVLLRTQR